MTNDAVSVHGVTRDDLIRDDLIRLVVGMQWIALVAAIDPDRGVYDVRWAAHRDLRPATTIVDEWLGVK